MCDSRLLVVLLVCVCGVIGQDSACYQKKMSCIPDLTPDSCTEAKLTTARSCIDNADCAGDVLSNSAVEAYYRKMVTLCQDPICLESLRSCFPKHNNKFSGMSELTSADVSGLCMELVAAQACLTAAESKCKTVQLAGLQAVASQLALPTVFVQTYCSRQMKRCPLTALQCLPSSFLSLDASIQSSDSCQNVTEVVECIENTKTQCVGATEESFRVLVKEKYQQQCASYPVEAANQCFSSISRTEQDPVKAACSIENLAPCVGDAKLYSQTTDQEAVVQKIEDAIVTDCVPQCNHDAVKTCAAQFCNIRNGFCKGDGNGHHGHHTLKKKKVVCRKIKDSLRCLRDSLVGCEKDEVKDILPKIKRGLTGSYMHHCRLGIRKPVNILVKGLRHRGYYSILDLL